MISFQEVILRLQTFWADQGAVIWQPDIEKVGAGTLNPATVLRVLGPEPWNVAYVEPSYRPDDGRYADNPNRMQMFYQYQVILKPDPGDPQERYLRSLEALGIRREEHDIRFVEDNWESPALGAWGLGWEVWLDGLEITQFTYFQQAGGINLDPPAVEITYGLERIVMFLQGVRSVWEINWDGQHTYGEIFRDQEVDYCRYQFEQANIERLQALYKAFEDEAILALDNGLARCTRCSRPRPRTAWRTGWSSPPTITSCAARTPSTCWMRAARWASPNARASSNACAPWHDAVRKTTWRSVNALAIRGSIALA